MPTTVTVATSRLALSKPGLPEVELAGAAEAVKVIGQASDTNDLTLWKAVQIGKDPRDLSPVMTYPIQWKPHEAAMLAAVLFE